MDSTVALAHSIIFLVLGPIEWSVRPTRVPGNGPVAACAMAQMLR